MRTREILLLVILFINFILCVYGKNTVAALGWITAAVLQSRVMIIKKKNDEK